MASIKLSQKIFPLLVRKTFKNLKKKSSVILMVREHLITGRLAVKTFPTENVLLWEHYCLLSLPVLNQACAAAHPGPTFCIPPTASFPHRSFHSHSPPPSLLQAFIAVQSSWVFIVAGRQQLRLLQDSSGSGNIRLLQLRRLHFAPSQERH